jgi:LL-diaminopimelate aminotransferase
MAFEKSQRLQALPPYLFIEIDKKKRAKIQSGADVINLGVGDPDQPTPKFIIDKMGEAITSRRTTATPSTRACRSSASPPRRSCSSVSASTLTPRPSC